MLAFEVSTEHSSGTQCANPAQCAAAIPMDQTARTTLVSTGSMLWPIPATSVSALVVAAVANLPITDASAAQPPAATASSRPVDELLCAELMM